MNLLNQKCSISRQTVTKNEYKHTVKSWAVINANVKCNIQYERITTNNLNQSESGLNTAGNYIGFFEKDENIKNGDKIVWGSLTLFVKGIPSPVYRGSSIHHLEALLSVEET